MSANKVGEKKYWSPEHTQLLHTLIEKGDIDPESYGKKNLVPIFENNPLFFEYKSGNKYITFRKHLREVISDRIINDTKNGKRRKGE